MFAAENLSREELVQKVHELQQGLSELALKELASHRHEVREREQALGLREARLAEREALLAAREAALALREQGYDQQNMSIAVSSAKGELADCGTPHSLKALMTPTPARSSAPVPTAVAGSGGSFAGRLGASAMPPLPAIGTSQASQASQASVSSTEEAGPVASPGLQLPQAPRPAAPPPAPITVDSMEKRVAPMLEGRAVTFMELRAELMGREQLSELQLRGYWQTLQPLEGTAQVTDGAALKPPTPPVAVPVASCSTPQPPTRRLSGPGEGSASKLKAMFEPGRPGSNSDTPSGSTGSARGARRTAPPMTAVMSATLSGAGQAQPRPKVSLADLLAADEAASLDRVKPPAHEAAALLLQQEAAPTAASQALAADGSPSPSEASAMMPQMSQEESIDRLAPAPRVSLAELLRKDEEGKSRASHGGSIM